ncbi:hypothetical protein M427DRAFT_30800 [Gonapodya prolifera JEL478]|uniref:Uncharacterized protein n=1 Tax=Gonapodya prolifera (strain JEL478) TaxID=1344416 RepID=A0A139AJK1_GONPJ|nr:hypothetical protein M427DRAFT_30800 [Gonapodya prolifera JEL478]|eukprot:KXS16980.1 hypothetical protein M427DRAFT_30800 [Gonapodya prolifera JEL478]
MAVGIALPLQIHKRRVRYLLVRDASLPCVSSPSEQPPADSAKFHHSVFSVKPSSPLSPLNYQLYRSEEDPFDGGRQPSVGHWLKILQVQGSLLGVRGGTAVERSMHGGHSEISGSSAGPPVCAALERTGWLTTSWPGFTDSSHLLGSSHGSGAH